MLSCLIGDNFVIKRTFFGLNLGEVGLQNRFLTQVAKIAA